MYSLPYFFSSDLLVISKCYVKLVINMFDRILTSLLRNQEMKEGNDLFNDAFNTFYLCLYAVGIKKSDADK